MSKERKIVASASCPAQEWYREEDFIHTTVTLKPGQTVQEAVAEAEQEAFRRLRDMQGGSPKEEP